jgi:hypothetical protein
LLFTAFGHIPISATATSAAAEPASRTSITALCPAPSSNRRHRPLHTYIVRRQANFDRAQSSELLLI